MNFQIVQPSGFLRNFIKDYCFMESDFFEEDVTERVIPIENVQLMFHYKNPFIVRNSSNSIKQPRSIISGLSDSFSDVSTNGETGVVFISFYPAGACHFFKFPLSEIENQSIDMRDMLGSEIREIEEILYLTKSKEERVSVIENFLLKRYSPIPLHDSKLIQKGIEIINLNKGQINAVLLSEDLSTTTKTLERKFSQYLGKTTKQIIKIIHFQEVIKGFSINKNLSLTERAYNHGYFDQSHFIHDFKTFSGFTPKEYIAKYQNVD